MKDALCKQTLRALISIEGILNDWMRARAVAARAYGLAYKDLRHTRKIRGGGGSHSNAQWKRLKAYYDNTCLRCGRQAPEVKITKDHIQPRTRGGTDFIENLQPLCDDCGNLKGDATIDYRQSLIALEAARRAAAKMEETSR